MRRNGRSPWGAVVGIVLLLLVAVIAIGAWRGWWSFDVAANGDGDRVQLEAEIDREQIGDDTEALGRRTRETAESVAVATEIETIRGRVSEIRPETDELVLQTETEPFTVKTSDATEFVADGGGLTLESLQVGQPLLVTYRERDGVNTALKIEATDQDAE